LGATGGTGRLIVRFRRGYGSLEGERQSAASRHDRGDARDEDIFTRSLVVKGAESPRLMHDPEDVPLMKHVEFVAYKSRLIAERFKPFKPQEEDHF